MRHTKKPILVSKMSIIGFCLFIFIFIVFERDIYEWWTDQFTLEQSNLQIDLSYRTVLQVNPNPDGIKWLDTKWTEDGIYVVIRNSRGQVYAKNFMVIDPENAKYTNPIQSLEGENYTGVLNQLPFPLEAREELWGGCQKENLFFTGKYIDSGFWETRLWKGDQLIKTFPHLEFRFGLYHNDFNNSPIGWTMEGSNFSLDCRYFTIDSHNKTWILDTKNLTFTPFDVSPPQFISDRLFSFLNTRCGECVTPVWSPNSHEFVFNSLDGIEKYDTFLNKLTWLTAPNSETSVREWSKTGTWILGFRGNKMVVISSDGKKIGTLPNCENIHHPTWSSKDIHTYIENPSWSPTGEKIAFICNQYDKSTCNDGKCAKSESFLIIWDLSNLDNN